jgi:ribosomal protein S18 acetylase RimI-like enzyme
VSSTRTADSSALVREVIERYLDAVPRSAADPEAVGKFTLFRGRGAWKYYARPRLGLTESITVGDVQQLRLRQRELALPEAIEWVVETTPSLRESARAAGMDTVEYPLMSLDRAAFEGRPGNADAVVRLIAADDPELRSGWAVTAVGFGAAGTAVGDEGSAERNAQAEAIKPETLGFIADRLRDGWSVAAAAFADGGPVSFGMHQPVGDVTEIVGVATLPAYRRRGLGAAVTAALVKHAFSNGIETVLLSAGSEDVARVYERVGFRRVGTAGGAEPPAGTASS